METTATSKAMNVEVTGRRVVMYGSHPETGKWFERYYQDIEAAQKYAAKRGWAVEVKGAK
jgi:hypothetical protein